MTQIIGVRRPGEAHIVFASTTHTLSVGQSLVVETPTETFTATVAIASGLLPTAIPPVAIAGAAHPVDDSTDHRAMSPSTEDERYRARKARFPALGERLSDGVVVRIDLRHENVTIRDDRGDMTTIAVNASPAEPT